MHHCQNQNYYYSIYFFLFNKILSYINEILKKSIYMKFFLFFFFFFFFFLKFIFYYIFFLLKKKKKKLVKNLLRIYKINI